MSAILVVTGASGAGADEGWRTASTQRWLAQLDALDGVRIAVLGLRRRVHIVLLECDRAVRDARLHARGQAGALGLVVIDTTALVIADVAERLAGVIRALAVERAS